MFPFLDLVIPAISSYVPVVMKHEALNVVHRHFHLISATASAMAIVMAFETFNIWPI